MNNIRAILFDVDGTLLDTREFILQAFEHALATHGFPPLGRDALSGNVGMKGLAEIYAEIADADTADALCETHIAFQHKNRHLSKTFANTAQTLATLRQKGFRLAAVTTRKKATSVQTLADAGIDRYFDSIVSGDDVTNLKPHPEPLLKALGVMDIMADNAVMVGDTPVDIQAGKNAGTKTIGATYGFHGIHIRQASPDHLIDDIAQILPILL